MPDASPALAMLDATDERSSWQLRPAATGREGGSMAERWDAGGMGRGQLVFELSRRVNDLAPGERLEVVARDAGAATDLPARCRMTGNVLVSGDHPVHVIERGRR